MRHLSICPPVAAIAAAALLASAGGAWAQSDNTPKVSANIGLTSDYIFRGFSQTGEDPAVQAGVDVTIGSFYAGTWASNVDFGDKTDAEIDLYGGVRGETSGFAWDVGFVSYLYAGEPHGAGYNYNELKLGVSRAIGPVTAGAVVYYSPDFYGADKTATYGELNASFTPAAKWTVSGAVGKQWLDVSDDYATWNAGVAYALTDNLALDVRYFGTDVDNVQAADDRVVATIKATF